MNKYRLMFILISAMILLSGCISTRGNIDGFELSKSSALPQGPLANFEYRIGDFDRLQIKVWEGAIVPLAKEGEVKERKEYRISRGDKLNIYVWEWSDLNRDVIVRPDGKISFPLAGDIVADGITLTELDDIITEQLKEYIRNPEVSIMVMEFGQGNFGTKKILENLPEDFIVRPDGRISFPFVGEIMVRGMTLRELDDRLAEELAKFIPSPEVYVNLAEVGGKRVIVLGEVNSPGVFKPKDNARLLDVIAMADGYTVNAALGSVILVRGGLNNPKAEKINLVNIMKRGDLRKNVYIQPEDIIYVPKTPISDINYFLTQLLGPLQSSGSAVSSIRTIRGRTTPATTTTTTR